MFALLKKIQFLEHFLRYWEEWKILTWRYSRMTLIILLINSWNEQIWHHRPTHPYTYKKGTSSVHVCTHEDGDIWSFDIYHVPSIIHLHFSRSSKANTKATAFQRCQCAIHTNPLRKVKSWAIGFFVGTSLFINDSSGVNCNTIALHAEYWLMFNSSASCFWSLKNVGI